MVFTILRMGSNRSLPHQQAGRHAKMQICGKATTKQILNPKFSSPLACLTIEEEKEEKELTTRRIQRIKSNARFYAAEKP